MDILLWLIVIIGYSIAIYCVYKTFVFAFSLFNEVPFVPSMKKISIEALKCLEIEDDDSFIDIGSGDGRVVFDAYKTYSKKAKYTGLEMSKALTFQANVKKLFMLNPKNLDFIKADAFAKRYNPYNKVYLYMTERVTSELLFKLEKELPKNSIVVSAVFSMGKFMEKHKVDVKSVKIGKKRYNIYIWKKEK